MFIYGSRFLGGLVVRSKLLAAGTRVSPTCHRGQHAMLQHRSSVIVLFYVVCLSVCLSGGLPM